MIAFEELVAALDRWRIRNGLPVVGDDLPAPAIAAPPAAAPAATWSPPPAPRAARPATDSDVVALDEADVAAEEELYDNEGDDYAMAFGGAAAGELGGAGTAAPDEATGMGPVPGADDAPAMPYGSPGSGPYGAYASGGSGPYASGGSGPYPPPEAAAEPSGPHAQAGAESYVQAGYAYGGHGGQPEEAQAGGGYEGGYAHGGYAEGGYAEPAQATGSAAGYADPYAQGADPAAGYDPAFGEPPPPDDEEALDADAAGVSIDDPAADAADDDAEWARLYSGASEPLDGGAATGATDDETVVGDDHRRR